MKLLLKKRLRELSESLVSIVGFLNAAQTISRDPKVPLVALYCGDGQASATDMTAIGSLMTAASVVLPIVSDLKRFGAAVPAELGGINGAEWPKKGAPHAIVNLVLENLGLLRRARRLFISYRRAESSEEALQLRHELDARGYDVFLDTHSVAKGDDFQEVLWQRLADSDVVVMLDTPGFMESRWTKEELAQAEAMTVGVVQVIWPGHVPAPYTDLCERTYLDQSDFRRTGLKPQTAQRIADIVERLRARSLAARHDNLVREFCDAASAVGIPAQVQPERFISAQLSSGTRIAAIPAVGVPDAFRYHEASRRFPGEEGVATLVFLVYDHRGLRPSWSGFLDWLDDFLPVKAVRITNIAGKLSSA